MGQSGSSAGGKCRRSCFAVPLVSQWHSHSTLGIGFHPLQGTGKAALAVVVGNKDGAHHTDAELFQALLEVGFTVPPGGATYWVGASRDASRHRR